ncbi:MULTISPECIES: transposase [Shewanella]|uniref:Transposase n=1 Tax=Shewanella metallivivens TaxID=2872342 RepID=A0ABT5TN04_9GAMM|nr:transposase [Shewanella metallivivens]MDD8059981.1 transposase [Shewanella metallivivens]
MTISTARHYSIDFQHQVINEVKVHNRLLSDVAKQYGISAKTVYKWVKQSDTRKSETRGEIVSEIAHLQQKITQLSQQLQAMAS